VEDSGHFPHLALAPERGSVRVFAFDNETFLIQPGKHVPKGVCASWTWGDETYIAHYNPRMGERDRIFEAMREALTTADVLSGANVAFDLAVVSQEFPELWGLVWKAYRDGRIWDVSITEKLINIGKGELKWKLMSDGSYQKVEYSLAALVKARLPEFPPLDKDTWRFKYGTLYDVPISEWPAGAVEYSLVDAAVTHLVQVLQLQEPAKYLYDAYAQARAGWWLHLMTCHGFKVDPHAVKVLEEHVRGRLARLSAQLQAAGLVRADGSRDTKAAAARMVYVCTALGREPKKTPKGQVQLTDEECSETGDPTLIAYAEYTSLSNILKKDVLALKQAADAGMPIQSRFDPLKETGRTGSSGGAKSKKGVRTEYSFQLQNVRRDPKPNADGSYPPTVRGCFVPRDGYRLCSIDWGQMELHAWAQVCLDLLGRSDLAKMLNDGIDVHCKLGSLITGRTYEEVYRARKTEAWAKDARQMAKAANFGFPGGLGAKKFCAYAKGSWGLVLTEKQGEELREAWRRMLSEADIYFAYISRLVEEGTDQQIVQTRSNRLRGGVGFTDGANGFFQGLAADCAKDAGFDLAEAFYVRPERACYGSRLVNMVHDEFLFEVPIDRDHEAAMDANSIMEAAGRRWMPDCPPRSEPALMMRWYKDAEAVYENGRLVPWRPRTPGPMEI
jgi:hypothetical protein